MAEDTRTNAFSAKRVDVAERVGCCLEAKIHLLVGSFCFDPAAQVFWFDGSAVPRFLAFRRRAHLLIPLITVSGGESLDKMSKGKFRAATVSCAKNNRKVFLQAIKGVRCFGAAPVLKFSVRV